MSTRNIVDVFNFKPNIIKFYPTKNLVGEAAP